ncbi:MAG TPA: hypothetical protein VHB27_12005 [Rhodopila sp.]|uniref:hypothetical protein n=1 Tax=Rhodopila sp. TaxID=2480087 RepID=UPI002B975F04|nr:hypothetical protein [Rhodopila sp.]HVY15944.1 hypothetical protein [Rhodopila sp.]
MAITPRTSAIANNLGVLSEIGGVLLSVGGGIIPFPPVVRNAGSADCVCTIYDGIDNTGTVLASFALAQTGGVAMPNTSYVHGLYATMTGTTAGTMSLWFTGPVAE